MQTKIEETFEIQAPVEAVWAFLMDPHRVVECMPGAELVEVEDERNLPRQYQAEGGICGGQLSDAGAIHRNRSRSVFCSNPSRGSENTKGGGRALGTMSSQSRALSDGVTEVTVGVEMDITGRMIEFGKGMIRSVSRQITKKFVSCAKGKLEVS